MYSSERADLNHSVKDYFGSVLEVNSSKNNVQGINWKINFHNS